MISWIREQVAGIWRSGKNSRTARRQSLEASAVNTMSLPPTTAVNNFPVYVISLEGTVTSISVKPDITIEKLKSLATKHFYGHDTSRSLNHYRLIHVTRSERLDDDRKISEEDIVSYDELMLVEVRPIPTKENLSEDALRGPNEDAIVRATERLPLLNPPRAMPPVDCATDFQSEIRKILITLTQASARILMHSPEAVKIYEIIRERLEARNKPPYDPKVVKHLMDIGFSEKKVLKALRLRKMNTSEALEWLIEHEDDPDEETLELPPLDPDFDANTPGPSFSRKNSVQENHNNLVRGGHGKKKEPNLVNVVALLLESFHQYRKLEFKPSPRLTESLKKMGFEEKDIVEALKITGNNHYNACDWLLGKRSRSLQDLDDGLDPDGPIYKAIMSNPHIQLSLTNPKMLLAYLSMLETPSTANIWINDPEASPVLSQIFKTYHSEKHAIHMNRYDNS
ncbi:ubiquitin-associated domain-containing protein 1 [Orussus abietinus]|uniref:ubiquitin-associated domain-containing protein 1 n=1 Tax=Orussus abietinus TaxID=222816 RepID=UPI0006263AFC|nr:ubiquitin-associated domain-containing protein 1 [Orussus abietinus]XP_012270241.1 ubiquitin-associated domain-containing protein 1 [Orussus abietinus]XP_012270242.1 ubiquitin-associated domain-containing protein 1 [Orussus abietinus]XP_012270243.1 ubiquitin-associated domain-containing protein 1 [Orussus abietinus]